MSAWSSAKSKSAGSGLEAPAPSSKPAPSKLQQTRRGLPERMFAPRAPPSSTSASSSVTGAVAPATNSSATAPIGSATQPTSTGASTVVDAKQPAKVINASGVDYRKYVVSLKQRPRPKYDVY